MITPNIAPGRKVWYSIGFLPTSRLWSIEKFISIGSQTQRTKSLDFIHHFREVGPDWITFPQWFKQNGYVTLATGRAFHPGLPPTLMNHYPGATMSRTTSQKMHIHSVSNGRIHTHVPTTRHSKRSVTERYVQHVIRFEIRNGERPFSSRRAQTAPTMERPQSSGHVRTD